MFINAKQLISHRQLQSIMAPAVSIAVILCAWYLISLNPQSSLPSPLQMTIDTWDLIIDPFFDKGGNNKGFFWMILASLERVAFGYSLAAIVGIAIGFIISSNKFIREAIDPIIQMLRPIAPLAWLPLAQAIFLKPNPSAIFVIFITAIWPIILNTALGVKLIAKDYTNVSKILGLTVFENFLQIQLPATLPYIFTGLRIALGLSWLAVVAAEMLLAYDGIGFFIIDAYNNSNISELILAMIYLGGVGLLLDKMMAYLSFKLTPQE